MKKLFPVLFLLIISCSQEEVIVDEFANCKPVVIELEASLADAETGLIEFDIRPSKNQNKGSVTAKEATSSGLDLRASNLAGDLSTAEKGGIRTKIGAVNVNRNLKMLTSADMPYTLLESDKDKFLNFQDGGTVKVDGNLMSFGEGVIGVNVSGVPLIFEGITVPEGEVKAPEGKIRSIKTYGTFSLYKSTYDPAFVLSGDLVTDFEIFESPNGTLYKVGVDDTGAITSIAL